MAPSGRDSLRIGADVVTSGVEEDASMLRIVSAGVLCAAVFMMSRDCAGEAKRHSASSSFMRWTLRACSVLPIAKLNCICRSRWLASLISPAWSHAWAIRSSCCSWITRVPSAATTRSRGSRFSSSSQVRAGALPTS